MADVGKYTIQGKGRNSVVIEVNENGDITVKATDSYYGLTHADFPNPLNGGGNEKAYDQLLSICKLLKNEEVRSDL